MSESVGFSAGVALGFSMLFIVVTTQVMALIRGRESLPPLAAKLSLGTRALRGEGNDLAPIVVWLLFVGVAVAFVIWLVASPGWSPTERVLLCTPLVVGAAWSIWLAVARSGSRS